MKSSDLTRRGNALGFTTQGETVAGQYDARSKTWRIFVDKGWGPSLTDGRNHTFVKKSEAIAYAETLIDPETTARLRWW